MNPEAASGNAFPIVALGASAGGLDALRRFFEAMPPDNGMAFIVVTHLDPARESHLAPILDRVTPMNVLTIEDGMRVEPGCVYVRPSDGVLSMRDGGLRIVAPESKQARYMPINMFFHSLAEEYGERAICIILSGTGTDGTIGLRAIKEHGGMCIAQADGSSAHSGMRMSAISTGLVDFVLEPAEMPACLIEYVGHMRQLEREKLEGKLIDGERTQLDRITARLHRATGYDFRQYKKSTLLRRVRRRMQVAKLTEPGEYVDLLDRVDGEAKLLFRDLLIGVTQFFRGDDAFNVLVADVAPAICSEKSPGEPIRCWVPGCSTGEEVYSLAMVFAEEIKRRGQAAKLQIFGTDIDEDALAVARTGIYGKDIENDVSPERLATWFRRTDDRYFIIDELREACTFSSHDLIQDPPFSKMDLVSCRNLFIYFEADLQKRLFPLLHFALVPGGYLMLGKSETVHGFDELFAPVDKAQRIFRRKEPAVKPRIEFPSGRVRPEMAPLSMRDGGMPSLRRLAEKYLLDHHVPACVVVDSGDRCVFFAGNTSEFLQPPSGGPNLNVLDMARAGLRGKLQGALEQARRSARSVREEFRAPLRDRERTLRLLIRPLATHKSRETYLLVMIEALDAEPAEPARQAPQTGTEEVQDHYAQSVERLEEELQTARYQLRTTTEDLETTNEELQSSNEELLSSNEELQSLVEELETSKEELQSVNEELHTVNEKQASTLAELNKANNDLLNLHASTNLPVLFLDRQLCVRMFTPSATDLFHLISGDVGRAIRDITRRHDYADFQKDAERVLRTGESIEREVVSEDDRQYIARIFPYRSAEGELTGAVATFLDVTELRRLHGEAELRARQQSSVAHVGLNAIGESDLRQTCREAVTEAKRILEADFCAMYELDPPGKRLLLRCGAGWDTRVEGEHGVPLGRASQAGYTLTVDTPVVVGDIGAESRFTLSADMVERGIVSSLSVAIACPSKPYGVLAVYSRKPRRFRQEDADFLQGMANLLATAIQRARNDAELLENQRRIALMEADEKIAHAERLASLGTLAAGIAHEINNPLNAIWMTAELAKQNIAQGAERSRLDQLMDRIVEECQRSAAITRGVLDFAKHKTELPMERVNLNSILQGIRSRASERLQEHDAALHLVLDETLPEINASTMEMERLFINLVNNAAEAGGTDIRVSTEKADGKIVVHVRDDGPGVPEENTHKIFDPFFSTRRGEGGSGLGLSLVHRSVVNLGGTISVSNQASGGADFCIELPLSDNGSRAAEGT